ncbi:RGase B [Phyllosticta citriasiana]|uniref:RGase B n=1 Tax=Phyllosticta citriasiana TaxID=595635 RepID=UPI0030FDC148
MHFSTTLLTALAVIPSLVHGQLSGLVGPKTTIEQKKGVKICDVTQFGAKADKSTDLGPALYKAHDACKTGGVIVIPKGDFAMATWVKLAGGAAWALQLDGIIYRTGTKVDNMIMIEHSRDVEVFSSTGEGAIQGNGFEFHKSNSRQGTGPRLMRFWDISDFSFHDVKLVDAPSFSLVIDTCSDGEIYNLVIRNAYIGGTDGIDVWGTNLWIHDCMITNKDECVTIKSPSKFILVESIHCNWSGGCGMGSLPANTDISNIHYKNIYTVKSNAMFIIKSKGGGGKVSAITLENFIGQSNAYGLNVDSNWMGQRPVAGSGVQISGVVATNWRGTMANGAERGFLKAVCANAPCTGIRLDDVVMGSEQGNQHRIECQSSYGEGGCLKPGTGGSYPSNAQLVDAPASGFDAPTLASDLTEDPGGSLPIAIPPFPNMFFPNIMPLKALAAGGGGGGGGEGGGSGGVGGVVATADQKTTTQQPAVGAETVKTLKRPPPSVRSRRRRRSVERAVA